MGEGGRRGAAWPWVKGAALVAFVLVMGALAWAGLVRGWFDLGRIEDFLRRLGWLAPFVYMLLMTLAVVTTLIPTLPLDIVAGAVFGPVLGTVYSVLGAEAGALIAFFIARALGREAVVRLLKRDIAFCDLCARRHLTLVIFFARLLPLFSFELVSYGAGLTKIDPRAYALSTLLGMVLPTFLLVTFGKGIFSTAHHGLLVGLGLLLVVLFFLGPIWIKRKNPWGLFDRMSGEEEP